MIGRLYQKKGNWNLLDQSLPPRTRLEKGGGGAIAGDLFSVWE